MWLVVAAISLAVALVLVGGRRAGTTAAGLRQATADTGTVVPDPVECDIEPRQLPLFDETPVAGESGADPSPTPFVIPDGERADEATVDAITEAVRGSLACRNAGDYLRAYAYFSDRFLHDLIGGPAGVDAALMAFLTESPTPVAEPERLTLVDVSEVRRLADDRVGAIVVTRSADEAYADYLFFVEADDGWLIDDRVFLSDKDFPPAP